MSAPIDVSAFMSNVGQFNDNERGLDEAPSIKLATVDSFDGNGLLRLIFDGESTATAKGYSWVNTAPRIGRRVLMYPMGATQVCLGEVNTNEIAELNAYVAMMPRGVIARSRLITPSTYVRNQSFDTGTQAVTVAANLDPNRLYRVGCEGVNIAVDNAPCRIGVSLRVAFQVAGSQVVTTTRIQESQGIANNAQRHDTIPCMSKYSPNQLGTATFGLVLSTITSISGTYPQSRIYAADFMPCDLFIEDMGVYI